MSASNDSIKAVAADWVARRDAGISEAESAELASWLAGDARHRAAFAKCERAWSALGRPYQAGVADDLLQAVEQRVRRRRRTGVASVVCTLAMVLAIGLVWRSARDGIGDVSKVETAIVIVPKRELLSDGSKVELKTGAAITAEFTDRFRRVVLEQGEAHFDVAKDASRPFVVVVGEVHLRAVGTAFSVRRDQTNLDVLVTEGQVAVDRQGEPAPPPSSPSVSEAPMPAEPAPQTVATLPAGYRAVVGISSADRAAPEVVQQTAAEISERLSWRAPQLEFTGTPLAEAVALLNEQAEKAMLAGQSARRYAIGDPEIGSMRVSGLFRVDNTDSFVRLLKHGFGIEAEQRDGSAEIVLRKAR